MTRVSLLDRVSQFAIVPILLTFLPSYASATVTAFNNPNQFSASASLITFAGSPVFARPTYLNGTGFRLTDGTGGPEVGSDPNRIREFGPAEGTFVQNITQTPASPLPGLAIYLPVLCVRFGVELRNYPGDLVTFTFLLGNNVTDSITIPGRNVAQPPASPNNIFYFSGFQTTNLFNQVQISASPNGFLAFDNIRYENAGSGNPAITEYLLPNGALPYKITAGPDGALWFTETSSNKIGRITTDGVITEFPVPTSYGSPRDIVSGADGALWFTANARIGRLTTSGVFTAYPLTSEQMQQPESIASGPDGALWFTEPYPGYIGRITTAGLITEFRLGISWSHPVRIAAGADGALWFTESNNQMIGRITTAGTVTYLPVQTGESTITAGPDGALWFTGTCLHYPNGAVTVGRLTTSGAVTYFTEPGGSACGAGPDGITEGPDGALWYTRNLAGTIGRVTVEGAFTVYSVPNRPDSIASGPDGNIWFTESNSRIAVMKLHPSPDATPPLVTSSVSSFPPGRSGWNVSNTHIDWIVSDPESGITSSSGCTPINLTTDTPGITLTCAATNGAGLTTSKSVTVKLDTVAPKISGMPGQSCTVPASNHYGAMVQLSSVSATDALSGVDPAAFQVTGASNQASPNPGEQQIQIAPDGSGGYTIRVRAYSAPGSTRVYSFTATASDKAGNTASVQGFCSVH